MSDRVQVLQSRIRQMQRRGLGVRTLPTPPAIAALLPDGALRAGAAYAVMPSHALLMAMLAGPSEAGSWCGAVGIPDLCLEAAAGYGIDLGRLALVPAPGDQWMSVAAALVDVMPVVAVQPPSSVSAADAARLAARLRQRGSTLIAVGPWPQAAARLSIAEASWGGVGEGHGRITHRDVIVTVRMGDGPARRGRLRLPDRDARLSSGPRLVALERQDVLERQSTQERQSGPALRTVV